MFFYAAKTPWGHLCVLLYNFCAFAMQMPLGIIADRWSKNYLFAIIGCALVWLAYAVVAAPVFAAPTFAAAVIVVGVGNAMFHIGGGIDVLNISEVKLGALGLFVSPGAFGVYYGTVLGRGVDFSAIAIQLSLLAAAALILVVQIAQKGAHPPNAAFSLEGAGSPRAFAIAACFFLVVCMRSFVGLSLDFAWKSIGHWGTALLCAVVLGKAAGGFIADKIGASKTALISLGMATLLFLLPNIPAAGVAAVLLFNMTMPITLWAMAKALPGAKGFAFGLLSFGLFLGFLPVYLGFVASQYAFLMFALICAVSLFTLMAGLRRSELRRSGLRRARL
jgi:FSR family fosmidomycin resistance protein-like MFS transporter